MWEIGLTIGNESGQVTVHPQTLEEASWSHAVEHAIDMAQALYPNQRVELNYVKEFDDANS